MGKRYEPVDLTRLKTFSIGAREHKFDAGAAAKLPARGASFSEWWASLPDQLGAAALRATAEAIVAARRSDRPVVWAIGAHVVKVGCSPIVIDLIRRGVVSAVAMNGATAIHDLELAIHGETSEEVADTIHDGRFGMVRETPAAFVEAMKGAGEHEGLGAALGRYLRGRAGARGVVSILAAAAEAGIPATVHVAIGTDTIHMHAAVAEADLGARSMLDFRLLCSVVADLAAAAPGQPGGVWCNIGSAVLLPEVFLKAVAVARNLGANLDAMVTANFDMIRHYRAIENVVRRPVRPGHGHQVTGHHEIMLPMLRQAVVEMM